MRKFITIALAATVGIALLAGCSAKKDAASGKDAVSVKVGTMGTYEPFTFVDAKNNLTGYDIEVLRLVEKADPSIKFEFVTGPWDSLFPGLDADKFQVLANQITSNPDRAAKYLLTDNSYALCVSQLIVKKGRGDIKSLADLKGKRSARPLATRLPGCSRIGTPRTGSPLPSSTTRRTSRRSFRIS